MTTLQRPRYLRYAASLVTAAYDKYAFIPRDLQALISGFLRSRLKKDFYEFVKIVCGAKKPVIDNPSNSIAC